MRVQEAEAAREKGCPLLNDAGCTPGQSEPASVGCGWQVAERRAVDRSKQPSKSTATKSTTSNACTQQRPYAAERHASVHIHYASIAFGQRAHMLRMGRLVRWQTPQGHSIFATRAWPIPHI